MFINKKFILASSSKSRFKILKDNKLNFIKKNPKCSEDKIKNQLKNKKTKPINISKILAKEKAKSISFFYPNYFVVGCDTVVILKNKIIDKALTNKQAKTTLKKMSNKQHLITSSLSVYKNKKQVWSTSQSSKIKIRKLSEKQINKYLKLAGKKVLFSAGCYQAESLGPMIIENIKGDFFNVMGFPLFPFLKFLERSK